MTSLCTTIPSISCIEPDSDVARAATSRANIFEMSAVAEQSVLRPKDCGAFGHDLRLALAARVARLAGDDDLATHYLADAGNKATLADPGVVDANLGSVLAFVDKVANNTRDIAAKDIEGLQAAGISDADIVRLCELVAFLTYQTRVIAGLRLMQGTAA